MAVGAGDAAQRACNVDVLRSRELISDFKGFDEEFDRLMMMAAKSRAPMTISLAQAGRNPNGWRKILAKQKCAGG